MTDAPQRSPEWFAARLGKLTASRFADAVGRTKTGWGTGRENYLTELLLERVNGVPADGLRVTKDMQWGLDTEAQARGAYIWETGASVVECGFIPHPTIPMSGASPDGLVGSDGLLEIKCPSSSIHKQFILPDMPIIKKEYALQMQWQMACTNRSWCDFISFDPRFVDEAAQLRIVRIHRDEEKIGEMEHQAREFLAELDHQVEVYCRKFRRTIARAA